MALVTIDEYEHRQTEIRARLEEIDSEYQGARLPDAVRSEWAELNEERDDNEVTLEELRARQTVIQSLDTESNREGERSFQVRRSGVARGNDIYDLTSVRSSVLEPGDALQELRDRAMRSLETAKFDHFATYGAENDRVRAHIEALLDRDMQQVEGRLSGELSRRMLVTGSPTYRSAMTKYITGRGMSADEQRALALGSGATGGFAVVYTLDPTLVPTSNFSVNPFRAIARVENITGTNEWKALTSGAITAAYSAEATETTDNAPTLAQPDIIVEKAQAFVPFSIEAGQDWTGLQQEMAGLLQDAKDDVEATKFAVGAGHGSNEPKGIITGATNTTTAGGAAAFAIADLYKLLEALPPRYRVRAQWMANLFVLDKVRQFDTAGGSGVWLDNDGVGSVRGLGPGADSGAAGTLTTAPGIPRLLNKAVWESTAMSAALTTGQKILIIGDWRYFVIVERVGMDIEVMPHLLGSNRRPTGQRGLYAWWRNSSDVLSAAAFQVLVTG